MAALLEAYITNLGKYAEGQLVGETLKFPTTAEEVQSLLKRIGVDGIRYEEIFITSFDGDVLGGFYVLVFLAYLFFEFFVVNYRPVLIEGVLEASYPSSTTMLMMCIMPTAIMQFHHLISSKRLRNIVNAFCGIYASFMVIGRVLSGVHWFTDIVGGILLSATLVMLYYSTNQLVNSKASRSSQRSR